MSMNGRSPGAVPVAGFSSEPVRWNPRDGSPMTSQVRSSELYRRAQGGRHHFDNLQKHRVPSSPPVFNTANGSLSLSVRQSDAHKVTRQTDALTLGLTAAIALIAEEVGSLLERNASSGHGWNGHSPGHAWHTRKMNQQFAGEP